MEWWLAILFLVGGLLVFMATGLPVVFSLLLINAIGVLLFWGGVQGLGHFILSMYSSIASFVLLPIPLFILMGELLFRSGRASKMILALDSAMGRVPGRLGLLAVLSGTVIATLTGTGIASTAIMGSVLTPEMERRGYKKPMSLGPILGSAGLAVMIPPSSLSILLASVGNISVAGVLIGGITPGLMMAAFYASYIIVRCWLQPSIAPSYELTPTPLRDKMVLIGRYVVPVAIVIFFVIGVIFLGIAGPSEAAATGVIGSLILIALYGGLNWRVVRESLWCSIKITLVILPIIMAAGVFAQILAFSGAARGLAAYIMSFSMPPTVVLLCMNAIVIFLGMFMGAGPIVMICVPVFMPIVNALHIDPVWFGVTMLLSLETGPTSPPFGTYLFVMKGLASPDTTMNDVYKAALPFLGLSMIVLALLLAFPSLTLWLPSMIR